MGQSNPCAGCPAPCCQMQLVPYRTPKTFMEVDHVRYLLLFPGTEMAVTTNGDWFYLRWVQCQEFDSEGCLCKVHHTPQQPRICFTYNAYDCWYKRNFVTDAPPNLYRLNLERFNVWVNEILFDEAGQIAQAPPFEDAQAIVKEIPIRPSFQAQAGTIALEDIRVA